MTVKISASFLSSPYLLLSESSDREAGSNLGRIESYQVSVN